MVDVMIKLDPEVVALFEKLIAVLVREARDLRLEADAPEYFAIRQ